MEHLERIRSPVSLAEYISNGAWRAYRHLTYISGKLVRAVTSPEQEFLSVQVSVRHGKALDLETPIPTPDGFRRMGDLRQGDRVFAGDGSVCHVAAVSNVWVDRPCYEVQMSDGDVVIADAEHEWVVEKGSSSSTIMTTEEAAVWLGKPRRDALAIPVACAEYEPQTLPVDPWALGYWLGNGHNSNGGVWCDVPDRDWVMARFLARGFDVSERPGSGDFGFGVLGMWPRLKAMGYGGKGNRFIPQQYLMGSREQRVALLNGLIDSDGYVAADGQVEFCSIVRGLAEQVRTLINSLGYKASLVEGDATIGGRFISRKYRVMFYMEGAASLPRKAVKCRDASGPRSRRYIHSIEKVAPRDTVCIEVTSEDHTFMCGTSHTRTHNSELISKYFVVWYLGLFPEKNILIVTYNEDFSKRWGRATRDLYAEWGPELFGHGVREDVSSTTEWKTTAGGGVKAVGVGGSITGLGFDLIIIDDPIKNIQEAVSPAHNEGQREWYDTTLRTRLTPKVIDPHTGEVISGGGTMILTMARWTDYDLAAYVTGEIDREGEVMYPDDWEVVRLPAVAEAPSDTEDYESWADELGRSEGEALWPEQWPIEALQPMMGTSAWDNLYQQNPVPRGGGIFAHDDWQLRSFPNESTGWRRVRFWDTAATKGGGDWTVGVLMGIDGQGFPWVLDVIRERVDSAGVSRLMIDTARNDGYGVAIRYEEAKAAAGKAVTTSYAKDLIGYDFKGIPATGSKQLRAALFAASQQNKLVRVVQAHWTSVFVDEHGRFDKGRHDDQVDAASGAFNELTQGGGISIFTASEVLGTDPIESIKEHVRGRGQPF